jgi:lipocalin
LEKGIAATKRALRLTPNDSSWFITRNLVLALFMDQQFEAIIELVRANIHAIDMHPDILVIWAYIKSKYGEKKEAKNSWEIATNRGFELKNKRWVSQLPKDLKEDLETTLKTISSFY